jgi:predicted RNase H-like nuclease (RuvC/YqgF family)
MTDEEVIKDYRKWEKEMKSKITQAHTDGYNRGLAKADEKIADLKANFDYVLEGKDLELREKDRQLNNWYLEWQKQEKRIEELEKENAELKGLKDVATLIRANNDTVVTLMQLNNKLVSKSQQLTIAKDLIHQFLIQNPISDWLPKKAEQFLKEIEK